jgi:hypothetical protein
VRPKYLDHGDRYTQSVSVLSARCGSPLALRLGQSQRCETHQIYNTKERQRKNQRKSAPYPSSTEAMKEGVEEQWSFLAQHPASRPPVSAPLPFRSAPELPTPMPRASSSSGLETSLLTSVVERTSRIAWLRRLSAKVSDLEVILPPPRCCAASASWR